jgi:hypothetical protein
VRGQKYLKFQHFPVHLVGDGESDMEKRDFKAKIGDFGLARLKTRLQGAGERPKWGRRENVLREKLRIRIKM